MTYLTPSNLSRWSASRRSILLATLALSTLPMPVRAVEEPSYRVVREIPGAEVRLYAAYTVAEVVVEGPAADAGAQTVLKAAGIKADAGVVGAEDANAFVAAACTRQWAREPSVRTLA